MCGICGVWYFDPHHHPDSARLTAMRDSMFHRGPDEGGEQVIGSCGFGFRRLSIIDLGGSHQPMPNEDSQVWIVFNGEIYNFQDLRARLAGKHTFRTVGDTETILHAYEEYGPHCVDYLRGMFAFAIYDQRADRLFAAVDRFGKKPLYYALDGEKFIFGSEMKAILAYGGLPREIDMEALDEYLTYGYITAPKSIFKAVRKLPPGHTLTLQRGGAAYVQPYWTPRMATPDEYDRRPLAAQAEELRALLVEATRLRMIADVPLGAFLSGGVDSSSVVGLMSHISARPVKTFSIGFDEAEFDETHYAQMVADHCKTDHTREVVRPDVVAVLPKLIHQYDEPFADSSMIPTYYVSWAARQHVTVALSGDGGDEVFAGYFQHRYTTRHNAVQRLIPAGLRPTAAAVARAVPSYAGPLRKVANYVKQVDRPAYHWGMQYSFFDPAQRGQLYTAGAAAALNGYAGEREKIRLYEQVKRLEGVSQVQYSDVCHYLPGDILVKVDRASMLASLEVRSPLLDHVVFEFMAKVPPEHKISLSDTKIILKKAVGNLIPDAIHTRNKMGFSIPQAEWLRGPLVPLLRETLTSTVARGRGLFEAGYVAGLIEDHVAGRAQYADKLWALLCFELWAAEYLDRA
jgi:asparagine synthase (glutamine-hydrolysing)